MIDDTDFCFKIEMEYFVRMFIIFLSQHINYRSFSFFFCLYFRL